MKRFYFNMIEILLAIAILSIGISSVMVLFTSGLRANNSTVHANALPDAVESSLSQIRLLSVLYSSENGWGDFVKNMPSTFGTENSDDFDVKNNPNIFLLQGRSAKYNFLYRQFGAGDGENAVEVFSAVIRVKRRSHNIPVVNPMTGDVISKDSQFYKDAEIEDRLNDSYADVEVEISYPADRPYAAREIKNFRLELYNDKYNKVCLP